MPATHIDYGRPEQGQYGIAESHQSRTSECSEEARAMESKLVIVMVGLPARGKSYIAKKLCRFLNWLECRTTIFNVGARRRKLLSAVASDSDPNDLKGHRAAFFDPDDVGAQAIRQQIAMDTLKELLSFLVTDQGDVGIFDATNSTRERRLSIVKLIREYAGPHLPILFIESQCYDEKTLEANMLLKLSGPDYKGHNLEEALKDFGTRVDMYARKYVSLGSYEEQLGYSFCQMIDVGRKFVLHNVHGNLTLKAVQFLQNFHLSSRQIWLAVSDSQSNDLVAESRSIPHTQSYANELATLINDHQAEWQPCNNIAEKHASECTPRISGAKVHVWASTSASNIEMTSYLNDRRYKINHLKHLDNTDEVAIETRTEVTNRLCPIVLELERISDHVLLIAGPKIIQLLLAYFKGVSRDEVDKYAAKQHTIYKIEPKPYGIECQSFAWHPE